MGSNFTLINHFGFKNNEDFFNQLWRKEKVDRIIWLSFDVDELGLASNPQITPGLSEDMAKKIISLFHSAPKKWLPAVYKNQSVISRLTIPLCHCMDDCPEIESLKPGQVNEYGMVLFTLKFQRFSKPELISEASKTSPKLYAPGIANSTKLDWSPDGSSILYLEPIFSAAEKRKTIGNVNLPLRLYKFSPGSCIASVALFSYLRTSKNLCQNATAEKERTLPQKLPKRRW